MAINFPTFPSELWVRIALYGGFTVCTTLCQVSKIFESIIKDPSLDKTWKREVYEVIEGGPVFGLLLDLLLEGAGSWREIFLACVVVERSLTTQHSYGESENSRASVLNVAQNIIDPLILRESHLDVDVPEAINEQIEVMQNAQRRMQHSKTYETLFLKLEILVREHPEDPEICYYLSECYFRGIGIQVNPEKAYAYALIAANKGYIPACCNLGAFYAKGFGIEQNCDEAKTWLDPLTTPQAKFFLGMIKKSEGDFLTAFHLIEEAALGGHIKAQYLAGLYYLNGYGDEEEGDPVVTEIDLVKSFQFFKLSAYQGHITAIFNLGKCYLQGFGTQKCFAKGFACLKLASRYDESCCFCSSEAFLAIENKADQLKMWQFLEEGSGKEGINSDMALWTISQESEEWKDRYGTFKKRKLS